MILKSIPCFNKTAQCGRICKKKMHCGIHKCTRLCHVGPCEIPVEPEGSGPPPEKSDQITDDTKEEKVENDTLSKSCGQLCQQPLATCPHLCQSICHVGRPCPELACTQKTQIFCECGRLSDKIPCFGNKKLNLPCDSMTQFIFF